ncbi:Bromodomain-containing protein [Sporormia fimetaria CBS 119925]|uniref:Bromodomain-containing protein n=1 Tax=Sporormia fimetaria CBS 119925 TaxID=1340428 RepID=A0A6A6VJ54_9PLEO|nr:Bromodomain-containing protein [Sporormia fimetaria CBS 119925]
MAVMTSPAVDNITLDGKPASFAPADAMALDAEENGAHDALFDEPLPKPDFTEPDTNGNHLPTPKENGDVMSAPESISADAAVENNIVEPQPPESAAAESQPEQDPPQESQNDEGTAPNDTLDDTQVVPETQLPSKVDSSATGDAMDTSEDVPVTSAPLEEGAVQPASTAPTKPMNDLSLAQPSSPDHDHGMDDAPLSGRVRGRDEFDDDTSAPEAKRARTASEAAENTTITEAPAQPPQTNGSGVAQAPMPPPALGTAPADHPEIQTAASYKEWPSSPMTQAQNRFLLERVRNTKKIKGALAFKEPVNPEALNIPTYRDIVKNPMDLSTMEAKLRGGEYTYVIDFMRDLDLIINNSLLFNGHSHPVTQAGYNIRSYFLRGMNLLPSSDMEAPSKQSKKKAHASSAPKVKREHRAAPATVKSPTTPAASATSPQAAWPLTAEGLPLIRRDSASINDRPKREIHRPPPKDLPYNTAKPRKKKYQQELRFCESVLSEIMSKKYIKFNWCFLQPVDPVALNIPTYLKIIKKPMDFGTIEKNLKAGQYQTAKDFYNDCMLVFHNCYKFNPEGDEVNRMGHQLNEVFDKLWSEKNDWIATHAPASDAHSPGSDYSDDDEDEEEDHDPAQQKLLELQQQIQALQEETQKLLKAKRTSPAASSKKKGVKAGAPKKKHSLSVPPPPKPVKQKARAKPAPLTFAQKQEISEGIGTLSTPDLSKAVQIIRNGCPHLAGADEEEMEIDMDEIDDDTLRELFKFIKKVNGPIKTVLKDDDYDPPRPVHKAMPNKPKKNKPMGKKEQEDSIRQLEAKLEAFENKDGGSESPAGKPPAKRDVPFADDGSAEHADESSDDESSGSESEEE